jgi:ubiquinone/menaquinone biosynthesis C-methylase UbiE
MQKETLNQAGSKTTKSINTAKVAKHWDSNGKNPPRQWLHNLYVREKVLLHPLKWHGGCWFNWLQRTYFQKPAENALSLCCGSGQNERRMVQVGIPKKMTALDISDGQLKRAREEAKKVGYDQIIDYQHANIQEVILPENQYDLVIVVAGLHHLVNLPHVFKQIHRTLKPEGIFVLTEYVGPDHMDYTPWERELIQKTLFSLDENKRQGKITGHLMERAGLQTREQAILRDPSEGVNSSLIMQNLRNYFNIDVEIEMGHSLLRECLYDLVDNFAYDDKKDQKILNDLIDLERSLRKHKIIKNHHVFGVYKPK